MKPDGRHPAGLSDPAPAADHLYLHVPFCAHRCGYCDFVTARAEPALVERYVDALIADVRRRAPRRPRTVFVGGGTPSLLPDPLLARLLGALPPAAEVTVECNPETVTPDKAATLVAGRVTRVSLGAQSFRPHLLRTLERRAGPETVRRAVHTLRGAGVRALNLDLLFGVPGQSPADLAADLDEALALAPDHLSAYELEAKPGTRFTHRHGAELGRQAELMEGYYERVVETVRGAGFRWYETANFCRPGAECLHNLGYWTGRDYLGLGVGAVSTLGLVRTRVAPSVRAYVEAVERGQPPPVTEERLTAEERGVERLMLGLRLDRPLVLDGLAPLVDEEAVARLAAAGMLQAEGGTLALSDRGRFVANEVVARILR